MRKVQLVVSALLLVLLLVSCAPAAAPVPATLQPVAPVVAPTASKPAAPAAPAKAAWEGEWERVLAEAKKEGVVAFGCSTGAEARRALSEGVKGAFGLRAESMTGPAGTIMSKVLAEQRVGLFLWDVMVGGTAAHMTMFVPGGGTSPLEPALILPDLTDPEVISKVWFGGKINWIDRGHRVIGALLYPFNPVGVNTELVKPGEIKTFDDLLNPKWKGKIIFMDPTLPGTNTDASLMLSLYEVKGKDWVRKLVAQELVIVRDDRLATDWLAHGKYPIYLPPRGEALLEFMQAGAPVAKLYPEDVAILTCGPTGISLIRNAPHINAAKVFINWYLSKEGVTIMSKVWQNPSARLDVPTDFLPRDSLLKPAGTYFFKDSEEMLAKIVDYRTTSKEIFGSLLK